MALASLADLKAYLSISTSADDATLTRLLDAASSWFESQVGRTLALAARTEVQDGNGGRSIVPHHYPVTEITSVTIDGVVIPSAPDATSDGWALVDGVIALRGYKATTGIANVSITYSAGYLAIPDDIQQAVIEVAADRYRYRTRVGEVSKSLGGESVSFVSFQTPFAVQTVIDAYRRSSF